MTEARWPRIWLLTETYVPVIGGGETQARALAKGLTEAGLVTSIVTRRSDPALAPEETVDRSKVHRLGPSGPGHLKKWAMLPGLAIFLLRRRLDYDLLLVCGYRVMGIAAVPVAGLLGKVCALKADNNGEMSGAYFDAGAARLGLARGRRLMGALISIRNRLLRRADAFVSLSSDIRAELLCGGIAADVIHDIPNSVDTQRFRPVDAATRIELRRQLGLPADGPLVIFSGRLMRSKGVLELAQVWRELAPRFPAAHLVIVGSGRGLMHDCEDELRAFIDDQGISATVTLTGFVDNVEAYLQAADVFAFPTTEEAFGIALIEAMACGLAAVASRLGGIKDILTDGVDGLFMESGDPVALKAALIRLLDDEALRARLGAAAIRTVQERYTTDAVIGRYAELLQTLHDIRSKPMAAATGPPF